MYPYHGNDQLCKKQKIGTSTERGRSKEVEESISKEGVSAGCTLRYNMQE